MFRRLFFLLLFTLITSAISFADGLSDVLAVCKIELKDGKAIEGVVWVAQGGYNRYYDTNGFYLKLNQKIEKVVLFNTDFYAFQPDKGIVELSPTQKTGWGLSAKKKGWFENPQIYYLHDVTSQKYQIANATEIKISADTLDSSIVLKRDIVNHNVYELLDYIPVYTEVPRELYSGQNVTLEPLKVYAKDVERFELVLEPSQKWLNQITSATADWIKMYQQEENFEVPRPDWFHQIMKEKEKYKDLFKSWNF
ncbi:MAG TPA: hypothetical protein VMT04_06790 [Terriglobales bacterium]|nr:hypothetical protein [Terriglobales bacterium]